LEYSLKSSYSAKYKELEHKVFQLFSSHLRGKKILIAVSGGLDSVLLLHVLASLQKRIDFHIIVAHVFHGAEKNGYRERAHSFVQNLAADLPYVSNVTVSNVTINRSKTSEDSSDELGFMFPKDDEQSLRQFRQSVLKKLKELTEADLIALGHHRDDLLETRLIRLVRGVGREGMTAMASKSNLVIRPFLSVWREDLFNIAKENGISFLEDPSNLNTRYLRNWIRTKWLEDLEIYRPGAKKSLGRSLEILSKESKSDIKRFREHFDESGVHRTAILALTNVEQRQVLASYLKQINVKNYSASHIDEVLKRLRSNKKNFEFRVASRVWNVSATRVRVGDS
jgi:tRNA(Ile)-lysidine synthase